MADPSLPTTVPDRPPPRAVSFDPLGPVEIADLLLFELCRGGAITIVVEPAGARHVVRREASGLSSDLGTMDAALGDAVVARLALVARLPLGDAHQVGRLRIRSAGSRPATTVELLLAVRGTAAGLSAELHRLGEAQPANAALPAQREPPFPAPDASHIGHYRVMSELGQGGMGIVYRAEHVVLQKPVAIKLLHPEVAKDPLVAAQFVVEARAACRARHPGIVDVTDFGTLRDGRAYLVMELVEAPTLSTLLFDGPVDAARALVLAREVATALSAASARGVVHRDLTPSNVFVLPGDRVKVGDFGLARIVGSSEPASSRREETVMGTAAYMSPEQGRGESADTRSDIYALGCVLYRMLTGRIPFPAASLVDAIAKHCCEPIPELESPFGPVPDVAAHVVERAMAKRPEERYQSFDEMLLEIGRATQALARSDWRRWLPK
jgi:eukaryotic-like serine/threonine-protein kinase